nr:MAG TPA: hypothetical protein [Caudoviricetes sp.]
MVGFILTIFFLSQKCEKQPFSLKIIIKRRFYNGR